MRLIIINVNCSWFRTSVTLVLLIYWILNWRLSILQHCIQLWTSLWLTAHSWLGLRVRSGAVQFQSWNVLRVRVLVQVLHICFRNTIVLLFSSCYVLDFMTRFLKSKWEGNHWSFPNSYAILQGSSKKTATIRNVYMLLLPDRI